MSKSSQLNGDTDKLTRGINDETRVLQDAKKCFRTTSEKTSKLVDVLTKCICHMLKGDTLTNKEATDLFVHLTFLFQYKNKDYTLRRLTYIAIKALSKQADSAFAVTASLTSDVNSSTGDPVVRASALRALCQISDASTLNTIECYLRQSIVDEHPVVASAALTSLIQIAEHDGEVVKRYTQEIQEALKSDSLMVQYHALVLSYISCKNDRLETSKLLQTCIDQKLSSPLAICFLLRILASYINDSPCSDVNVKLYTRYICDCLSHKSEMVEYEAANTMVAINKEPAALAKAINHLRNFLTAPKAALRFCAVRQLNGHLGSASQDTRCWSIQRIGNLCKLHLLTKRYKPGDEIIGILEFVKSSVVCAKYTCSLQCESIQMFEVRHEFTLGYKQCDFVITIPETLDLAQVVGEESQVDDDDDGHQNYAAPAALDDNDDQTTALHCVLSFLFYITDRNYPRVLFEDKVGTIELGPDELETKQFSCDFPILINTLQSSRVNTCIAGADV